MRSAAVNACALGSWEAAWWLLQGMEGEQLPTKYGLSALIKSMGQAMEWQKALQLFDASDADLEPWTFEMGEVKNMGCHILTGP